MENMVAGLGHDRSRSSTEGVILAALVGRTYICYRGLEFVLVESQGLGETAQPARSLDTRSRR